MPGQRRYDSQKRKRMARKKRRILVVASVVLIVAAVTLFCILLARRASGNGTGSSSSDQQLLSSQDSQPPPSSRQESSSQPPEGSSSSTPLASSGSDESGSSSSFQNHTASPSAQPPSTVPESAPVDNSYFDDALFIGDSRVDDFGIYSGLKSKFYASTGLNVNTVFTKQFVKVNGQKYTVPQALNQQKFKKVYVKLGVNELGWYYSNVFVEQYAKLIDLIKKTQPDAEIYVQSVIAVSKEKNDKDTEGFNNKKVLEYNQLLSQMAKEKGVHYLNLNEDLADKDGNLFADASTDGIHPTKEYCLVWLDYLKNHTAKS